MKQALASLILNFSVDSSVNMATGAIFGTGAKNLFLSLVRCLSAHQSGQEMIPTYSKSLS